MKSYKNEFSKELQLQVAEVEQSQKNLFQAMSLNELLAALELIIECENVSRERFYSEDNQQKIKYLN